MVTAEVYRGNCRGKDLQITVYMGKIIAAAVPMQNSNFSVCLGNSIADVITAEFQ